jgi:hypothetical protein
MPILIFPCQDPAAAEQIVNDLRTRQDSPQELGITVENDSSGQSQVVVEAKPAANAKAATTSS